MNRKPAVAGQFYPLNPQVLDREVTSLLEGVSERKKAIGVVSPHAGYIYSGKVAGQVFSRVEIPKSVVILGPNHRGVGEEVAVMSGGTWEMPFGGVSIDGKLARLILGLSPLAAEDSRAHAAEHSLEVQVPFIQKLRPDFLMVPVVLGPLSLADCLAFGKALASAVRGTDGDVLIVASSDMTHYESAEVATKKDRRVIDEVIRLDPEAVYTTVRDNGITMCGVIPVTVLLSAARELGAKKAELVNYMTSGDTSGDYQSVVGYAGVVVW